MLERIAEIKSKENGFSKGSMKWRNFSSGTITTHISDFDFSTCNDTELLFLFERVVKRYYAQY